MLCTVFLKHCHIHMQNSSVLCLSLNTFSSTFFFYECSSKRDNFPIPFHLSLIFSILYKRSVGWLETNRTSGCMKETKRSFTNLLNCSLDRKSQWGLYWDYSILNLRVHSLPRFLIMVVNHDYPFNLYWSVLLL